MLSKLRPRSIYDVMAAIACFVALAGGTAYAANTIRTGDIVDNEVFTTDVRNDTLGFGGLTHPDLGPGSVRTSEILDSSLNDEDISQTRSVHFAVNVGSIASTNCVDRIVSGLSARGDHLLLTPNGDDANGALVYDALYDLNFDNVIIHVCNFSNATIDDGTTHFNLLVIDAQ
jgi:hypothetical protein